MAGEESVGEASFTPLVFAHSAIFEPATNVGAHGWPEVVAGERGMNLGVGDVVEVGVVLASEGFAEIVGNDYAGGKIGVAVDVKAIARGDRSGIKRCDAIEVGELGGLPFIEGGGEVGVAGGRENFEKRGGAK